MKNKLGMGVIGAIIVASAIFAILSGFVVSIKRGLYKDNSCISTNVTSYNK